MDTEQFRKQLLLSAGLDICDVPEALDTDTWRKLLLIAITQVVSAARDSFRLKDPDTGKVWEFTVSEGQLERKELP